MQTLAAVRCDPLDWDTHQPTNIQWCRMHRQLFDHHDGCPGDVTADTYPDDRDADMPHPEMMPVYPMDPDPRAPKPMPVYPPSKPKPQQPKPQPKPQKPNR